MLLLAATLFIAAPTDAKPAERHERDASWPAPEAVPIPPRSVWHIQPTGDAWHRQTTLACPKSLGKFLLGKLSAYDAFGLDVGCTYASSRDALISVSLAMRAGQSLRDDFEAAQTALTKRHIDTRILANQHNSPIAGTGEVRTRAYVIHGSAEITRLWVADIAGWTLTYRATSHAGAIDETSRALSNLHRIIEETARAHLAACAAAPPVDRNGVRVTDAQVIQRLTLIGGLSAQAADEPAVTAVPERWCVEEAVRDPQAPMLFWRNIEVQEDSIFGLGPSGPVDRLTLMTMEDPPTWTIEADTGANMLIDKPGDRTPVVHALIRRESYLTSMFAFFRGRPSMATLAPLMRDVALGKVRPVATANGKSGVVTIPKEAP